MTEGRRPARIVAAQPIEGFTVHLRFSDGTEKTIDLSRYVQGPIFQLLRGDANLFRAVTVDQELGTIVWPNGADLDPDVLRYDLTPAAWEDEAPTGEIAAGQAARTAG